MNKGRSRTTTIFIIGALAVLAIVIVGTILMGHSASGDTQEAVRKVSLLYLDELAGRREQVVENNLKRNIEVMEVAVALMRMTIRAVWNVCGTTRRG